MSENAVPSSPAHRLRSFTFVYDGGEDRLLLACNLGLPNSLSFWLTRRQMHMLLDKVSPFLFQTSDHAVRTPTDLRGELAAMERQVALAATQKNLSQTPRGIVQAVPGAVLVSKLTLSRDGPFFRLEIVDRLGREAFGTCTRHELQGIIDMMEKEMIRAGWSETPMAAAGEPIAVPLSRQN